MALIHPQKAYQYFKEHFVLASPSPKKWFAFDCPFCGKRRKCAVQFKHNRVKCWSCALDGSIIDFVSAIEKVSEYEAERIIWAVIPSNFRADLLEELATDVKATEAAKLSGIGLPFGFKSLLEGDGPMGREARAVLERRGFNIKKMDEYGFGYCNRHNLDNENEDYWGYIIIPYKRRGRLVYYIGRDYMNNYLRYKNPGSDVVGGVGKGGVIFNEDALSLYDTAFILEGALDAYTMGNQGTATSGWQFSKYQMGAYHNSKCKRLVFVPDVGIDPHTGLTFYQKAVQVATEFLDSGKQIYVVNLDIPEFNKLGKDANEIGRSNVIAKYKDTPPLTWSDAMKILTN